MKLHNILYSAGFLCLVIGALGIDGWMYKGTSLAVPVLLIVLAMCLWYFGMKEDGRIRKGGKKNVWKNAVTVQHADTVTVTSRTWIILRYPCRSVCVIAKIMKKSSKKNLRQQAPKEKKLKVHVLIMAWGKGKVNDRKSGNV